MSELGHSRRNCNARNKVRSAPNQTLLDQLQPFQARMPILADDDVVVHGNSERFRRRDDRLRHVDVGARGGGIAGRMVVHQPTARVSALISQNVSNHPNQQGTGIGGGKSFEFFIITFRHAASRSLNFDHVQF
jgi:hypothetical protein